MISSLDKKLLKRKKDQGVERLKDVFYPKLELGNKQAMGVEKPFSNLINVYSLGAIVQADEYVGLHYKNGEIKQFRKSINGKKLRRDFSFGMSYCGIGDGFENFHISLDFNAVFDCEMSEIPNIFKINQKKVSIDKGFWMLSTLVTQDIWYGVMNKKSFLSNGYRNRNKPIEVSFWDALVFCNKLSDMFGFKQIYKNINTQTKMVELDLDADGFRLPFEEEWEYAARANCDYIYSGSNDIDEVGWIFDNAPKNYRYGKSTICSKISNVKEKKPNAWGIYDMSGNVYEWTDSFAFFYNGKEHERGQAIYNSTTKQMHKAMKSGEMKQMDRGTTIIKGGASNSKCYEAMIVFREWVGTNIAGCGFRFVKNT